MVRLLLLFVLAGCAHETAKWDHTDEAESVCRPNGAMPKATIVVCQSWCLKEIHK